MVLAARTRTLRCPICPRNTRSREGANTTLPRQRKREAPDFTPRLFGETMVAMPVASTEIKMSWHTCIAPNFYIPPPLHASFILQKLPRPHFYRPHCLQDSGVPRVVLPHLMPESFARKFTAHDLVARREELHHEPALFTKAAGGHSPLRLWATS